MYNILIKLIIAAALVDLGISFSKLEDCSSRQCWTQIQKASRKAAALMYYYEWLLALPNGPYFLLCFFFAKPRLSQTASIFWQRISAFKLSIHNSPCVGCSLLVLCHWASSFNGCSGRNGRTLNIL